jgi:single-strand DNA-binding protein
MNNWSITGNLGGDVKVNNVSGTAVANFSVAVKAGYGEKAQTIWVAAALWGKQAESKLVDYLVKGQMVALSGEMSMRDHDGKSYVQLRVNTIDLIGGKSEGGNSAPRPQQNSSAPQQQQPADDFSEDIPF